VLEFLKHFIVYLEFTKNKSNKSIFSSELSPHEKSISSTFFERNGRLLGAWSVLIFQKIMNLINFPKHYQVFEKYECPNFSHTILYSWKWN